MPSPDMPLPQRLEEVTAPGSPGFTFGTKISSMCFDNTPCKNQGVYWCRLVS